MNALLLSAGLGERLRPLTFKTPKCLLPLINNQPILGYWIDLLINVSIEKIFINTFWLKHEVISYITNLNADIQNKIYIHNENYLESTGEVLSKLGNMMGNKFLIINSDTYIKKKEVERFISKAINHPPEIPIFMGFERKHNIEGKGLISLAKGSRIIDFIEKPNIKGPGYTYAGIMLMRKSVVDNYTAEDLIKKELTRDIIPDFKNKMVGINIRGSMDIGNSIYAYYQVKKIVNGK